MESDAAELPQHVKQVQQLSALLQKDKDSSDSVTWVPELIPMFVQKAIETVLSTSQAGKGCLQHSSSTKLVPCPHKTWHEASMFVIRIRWFICSTEVSMARAHYVASIRQVLMMLSETPQQQRAPRVHPMTSQPLLMLPARQQKQHQQHLQLPWQLAHSICGSAAAAGTQLTGCSPHAWCQTACPQLQQQSQLEGWQRWR